MSRVAIIGAGAWGTALAMVLGRKTVHSVRLWANEPDVCESVSQVGRPEIEKLTVVFVALSLYANDAGLKDPP